MILRNVLSQFFIVKCFSKSLLVLKCLYLKNELQVGGLKSLLLESDSQAQTKLSAKLKKILQPLSQLEIFKVPLNLLQKTFV